MNIREFKNRIYTELASISKAMSNPHRLEIIDLLAQGACSVEYVAEHTQITIANASQHLQVLKQARLVRSEKRGKYSYYSLSDAKVFEFWQAMRDIGYSRNAEIRQLLDELQTSRNNLESVSCEELLSRLKDGEALALDVRPREEYEEGHISDAISIPADELERKIEELPEDREIIAYCRGPLCAMADDAVEKLRNKGYKAKRLSEGYPDWASKGLPVDE